MEKVICRMRSLLLACFFVSVPVFAQVVTISAPDDSASEAGVFPGQFRVERTGGTSSPLVVNLAYSGNAVADADYLPLPVTVTIPAGSASVNLAVDPISDPDVESGPESVVATVVAGAGYSVGSPASASVSILSDEALTNVSPFLHTVAQVSATSLRVEWTDNFDNETRFRLQRAPAGTSSWSSTDLPPNTTSHTVTGLTQGVVYDFRVQASTSNNTTHSPQSAVVRQIALAPSTQPPATFEQWRRVAGLAGTLRAAQGRTTDDPDADGKPNLIEYLVGSNPLAPDATGLALGTAPGGALEISWPAADAARLDATLALQETGNLTTAWQASPLTVTTANGTRKVTETREGDSRFYRLAGSPAISTTPSSTITCWGDSLTGNPGTYAELLRSGTVLGNRTVRNCGIGGDISQQIRDRMIGLTITEPFAPMSGNSSAFTRIVASRTVHTRIMMPASYRGQWAGYAATIANVSRVEFFNYGEKIGESSTPLAATVTSNITANATRLIAPGNPFENGMIVHFPSGPLPSPLVVGKTYFVRDRDAGGFSLVEGDVQTSVTANTTVPSSRFVSAGHPFQNGDTAWFPSAPPGLLSNTLYVVRDADAGGFSLANSANGTALSMVYNSSVPIRGRVATTPVALTGNFAAPTPVHGPFVLNWSHSGGPVSLSLRTHTDRDADTFIFWMGRNNGTRPHETLAHLRDAVEQIKAMNGRFLILSVTNGGNEYYTLSGAPYYYPVIQLNALLRREFPDNFIDIRSALLRAASSSTQDQTDRANDIPPSSLRGDAVHFNSAGQQIIADVVAAELARRGW